MTSEKEKIMKEWNEPQLEEVLLSDTQYGGTSTTDFDDIYVNGYGFWEGTFVTS